MGPRAINAGVGRQHPDCGPHTQTLRHQSAYFHTAVSPVAFAQSAQSRRRILFTHGHIVGVIGGIFLIVRWPADLFFQCADVQHAIVHEAVVGGVGVALSLIITATPAVDFVGPLRGIDTVAFKLTDPHQRPTRGPFISLPLRLIIPILLVVTIAVVATIAVAVAIAGVVTGLVRIIWWPRRRVLVTATAADTGAEQQDQDA